MIVLSVGAFIYAWCAFPFPMHRLEDWPISPRVTDRSGQTLLDLVAEDQQWRFPVALSEVSPWVVKATIAVEDHRFREHLGVDPWAVARATWQNLTAGRVVSGASTLTMQLCRMMDPRPRSLSAKAVEAFRALQLERLRGKDWIIQAYLNLAPYGRNLRGVEAAAQAYFGKSAKDLSLGESALLAGLPQSPARFRPDRFPDLARARRDMVLRRMEELGIISAQQRQDASGEPLAIAPRARSDAAAQAARMALNRRPAGGRTTIDLGLQTEVQHLATAYLRRLRSAGPDADGPRSPALPSDADLSVVVLDIPTGDILAVVGSADANDPIDGQVNGVLGWRSPGSALKPFVYAAAFEARRLSPDSIVYDVPIHRVGWSPANFDRTFCGELPAAEALRRSLNIPAILVAEQVGLDRCVGLMQAAGVKLPPDAGVRGGLAVVTGAIEVRLLDLVSAYATLGRGGVRRDPRLFADQTNEPIRVLDADVCGALDDILSSRRRTPRGMERLPPEQTPWFMWKTGTSSARRDAWAVGHNGRCAIGVWVGRFRGAGCVDFVGGQVAEPLLGQLFSLPAIRSDRAAAKPGSWIVTNPLPRPAEVAEPLRITNPANASVFLAMSSAAVVHPAANREQDLRWFLNGSLLGPTSIGRLVLAPGSYELRCVDPAGNASSVRFAVK
jgi:penicillin-binding protein 1C